MCLQRVQFGVLCVLQHRLPGVDALLPPCWGGVSVLCGVQVLGYAALCHLKLRRAGLQMCATTLDSFLALALGIEVRLAVFLAVSDQLGHLTGPCNIFFLQWIFIVPVAQLVNYFENRSKNTSLLLFKRSSPSHISVEGTNKGKRVNSTSICNCGET